MSRFRTAALGAVVVLGIAGVAGAQTQARQDGAGRHNGRHGQMGQRGHRGMRGGNGMRGDHGKLMADLKLTDTQKNQIKAIHTKYEPQFKAQREDFRTRSMAIHQQEQNEVRGILTADQRSKWDAAQAQRKTKMDARQKQMKERGAQLKKSGKA